MKREIKFNSLYSSSNYTKNLEKLFANYELFRQKHFSNLCLDLLKEDYPDSELMLTHSATGALEMIALALDIQPGDEVILPSYTFVSTANAFALRGAKLIFVDIELDTFGIDPKLVQQAISAKTKAIVCMHYAGQACQIEELKEITTKHGIPLIEDAATAFGSKYKGKALGTFGDFGVVSFDITKHISATQGGMLILNNLSLSEKVHKIYHTGTNRNAFQQGVVPYYEWVSLGSKYQMSETNAVILEDQLAQKEAVLKTLSSLSAYYYELLSPLKDSNNIEIKAYLGTANYHESFIVCKSKEERLSLQHHLQENGIEALLHYQPLHKSKFGKQYSFITKCDYTSTVSDTLLRLPHHTGLVKDDIRYICSNIAKFFENA
jgi:dTDP-4-amino-4,6-dideoxygalactose transaminase